MNEDYMLKLAEALHELKSIGCSIQNYQISPETGEILLPDPKRCCQPPDLPILLGLAIFEKLDDITNVSELLEKILEILIESNEVSDLAPTNYQLMCSASGLGFYLIYGITNVETGSHTIYHLINGTGEPQEGFPDDAIPCGLDEEGNFDTEYIQVCIQGPILGTEFFEYTPALMSINRMGVTYHILAEHGELLVYTLAEGETVHLGECNCEEVDLFHKYPEVTGEVNYEFYYNPTQDKECGYCSPYTSTGINGYPEHPLVGGAKITTSGVIGLEGFDTQGLCAVTVHGFITIPKCSKPVRIAPIGNFSDGGTTLYIGGATLHIEGENNTDGSRAILLPPTTDDFTTYEFRWLIWGIMIDPNLELMSDHEDGTYNRIPGELISTNSQYLGSTHYILGCDGCLRQGCLDNRYDNYIESNDDECNRKLLAMMQSTPCETSVLFKLGEFNPINNISESGCCSN